MSFHIRRVISVFHIQFTRFLIYVLSKNKYIVGTQIKIRYYSSEYLFSLNTDYVNKNLTFYWYF